MKRQAKAKQFVPQKSIKRLKVDIAVGGRFHSDHMAQAFLKAGHDVRLFTTFPASRFPNLPKSLVHSFVVPELVFRGLSRVGFENSGDLYKMQKFGADIAKTFVTETDRELLIAWSSFALEAFVHHRALRKVLVRDSAHILFQSEVLKKEHERLGLPFPERRVCEDRELAEYELADLILVPSEFARNTFLDRGFSKEKLKILPLAVDATRFSPPQSIQTNTPLRVIYFGNISVQKGVIHLLEATKGFSKEEVSVSLVGHIDDNFKSILSNYSHFKWHAPMTHVRLAEELRTQHVFVFPTLHDGFGQTLPQAMGCGLVPIVSDSCGAASLVSHGKNGFVLPAGDPSAIRRRIDLLRRNPEETTRLRKAAAAKGIRRTWDDYASDLLDLLE